MSKTGPELIYVSYTKSAIGYSKRQKATVRSLGLRKLGDGVIHADSPAIRGMVQAVNHLVTMEPVDPALLELMDAYEGDEPEAVTEDHAAEATEAAPAKKSARKKKGDDDETA